MKRKELKKGNWQKWAEDVVGREARYSEFRSFLPYLLPLAFIYLYYYCEGLIIRWIAAVKNGCQSGLEAKRNRLLEQRPPNPT